MKNNLSLQFDRLLTLKEHVFWNNFFTNFPCDSNRYLQSWVEKYKDLNTLTQDYEQIRLSNSYNCLKDNPNIQEFVKANKYYELLCPDAKKENHFLMCIYGLACQDWPIEVNKEGIYITKSNASQTDWEKSTIAITLSMCVDLMSGRINHIYPILKNINSVKLSGTLGLETKNSHEILLEIKDSKVKRYIRKNIGYSVDFEYSFANNGDDINSLTPFGKNQENFLKFLYHQKLDEEIVPKIFSLLSKKIKI